MRTWRPLLSTLLPISSQFRFTPPPTSHKTTFLSTSDIRLLSSSAGRGSRLQLQSDAGRKRGEGRWKCGGDDWGIISLSQFLIICAHQQILNLSILWVLTHWGQCSKLVNLPQTCPPSPSSSRTPEHISGYPPPPLQDKKGKILQVACCNADLNVRLSVSGNEWRFQINETHPDSNLSQRAVSWCVPVKTSAQIKLMFMLQ